jgi:hypothetical protein
MDDVTLLSWIERGKNFAALLVAVGVGAEFVLGFMAGPPRNHISEAKDTEIRTVGERALEKEAVSLRKEAAGLTASNLRLEESNSAAPVDCKASARIRVPNKFSGRTVDIRLYANDVEGS